MLDGDVQEGQTEGDVGAGFLVELPTPRAKQRKAPSLERTGSCIVVRWKATAKARERHGQSFSDKNQEAIKGSGVKARYKGR